VTVQAQYLAYILEQLAGLGALRTNRMFGAVGLYSKELFFGLIDDDTLFFKTDESDAALHAGPGQAGIGVRLSPGAG
jgi:DNA transformation protein and related proteins